MIGLFSGIVKLLGGTDGTVIGNSGDSLKVSSVTPTQQYVDNNQLYAAAVDVSMASSNTDNPLIYFRNPSGSGKRMYIRAISCGCTVTNVGAEWKIFSMPTVTVNGTSLPAYARNLNNSQPAATALVTTLPTVSSSGNFQGVLVTGQNTTSITFSEDYSICLQPNSAILLTGSPSSNNRNAAISLAWAEVTI